MMYITSFLKFIYTLLKSIVTGKKVIAKGEVIECRRNICATCPLNKKGLCRGCGCIIKTKTMFRDSVCPIGIWGKSK